MSQAKICPQCGGEFSLDQRFCPSDGSTLRVQGGSADLVGSVVADRYHVVRKLGEGGMGQVYLAEHVKIGRRCALKIMNATMGGDADAVARFNREAANASRINHPNVAAVHDFGETTDGIIYLAMEFVEGPSLTQLLQEHGALPPLRAAAIVRQVAEALSLAHDMGIVHRDLKPDNIMVARTRDGADLVKVVDFGIAKAADAPAQQVTRTGLVVGTPEYMSPEQLAGDRLDGRSDVYALGLVAFNMLTGRLPFPAETVQEALIMRLTEAPKRLAEMRTDVDWTPEVQAALDRALARDAGKRYATASDFGHELYAAVERMEAMDGGRPAPSAARRRTRDARRVASPPRGVIPTTRVSAAPAPARRTPVLAAATLLVLAAAGAALLAMRGHTPAAAATPSGQLARQAGDSTIAHDDVATRRVVPHHAPTRRAAPNATPAPAGTPVSTELSRLERLTDPAQGADSASARRAIAALDRLQPRITDAEDVVHAQVIRAEARMALQDDASACRILRDIAPRARGTTRHNRVTYLLGYACQ